MLFRSLQVIDVKDPKFTIYSMSTDIEGLVTYSKVERVNRGYITHYTIKFTLKDQDYSSMIIEEIKIIILLLR